MNRYALHIGILNIPDEGGYEGLQEALDDHVRDALGGNWYDEPTNVEVFVQGDSFVEWGEPVQPEDVYCHGMVFWDAPSPGVAWSQAVAIYRDLLIHEDPLVSLSASCWPSANAHVPFAVSSAEDWGDTYGPGGVKAVSA